VPRFMTALEQALACDEPCIVEYTLPIGGELRHYEARMVRCEADKVLSIVRDMTDRRRAERTLRDAEAALRLSSERVHTLAGRLIAAQESERRRIAHDLHDDLSQKLALLSINLERLGASGGTEDVEDLSARVQQLSGEVGEIATSIHSLSHMLHPSRLETLGLVAALASVCRDLSTQHGLRIDFRHDSVPAVVSPDTALCLYRVVQEALHNIVKHSRARQASVRLSGRDGQLDLLVEDSGRGFDPQTASPVGLGLISMQERVNYLGGRLAVRSTPGVGTRISVSVPVKEARQGAQKNAVAGFA